MHQERPELKRGSGGKHEGRRNGANPKRRDRAIKAGRLSRTSGRSAGDQSEAARCRPRRTLSLPQRPLAKPGDQHEEKSVELK